MNKNKWYLDWFVWLDYTILILFVFMLYSSFPLQRWEWGFSNDKLIATILFGLFWLIVRTNIIQERRWKWIKNEVGK